ncbi:MAG: glycosyltransferase family 2 protein [Deltaproteobacteria bacterium]|nr:glycosyltransferase family 2 protein [Deltaproteobacteria bacterium]
MRACAIIPAYEASRTIGPVVREASRHIERVIVVDDGSTDGTGDLARDAGADVVGHGRNLGKGEALTSGLSRARALGFDVAVSLDSDGQHDPAEIPKVLVGSPDPRAIVIGVRDLVAAGAPRANVFSNTISNFFLSLFIGEDLPDTQCGFRRYPVLPTLALGMRGWRYEWEAEVLIRAARAGLPIVPMPVHVRYPEERLTFFVPSRDVRRIIRRVILTELGA